MLKLLEHLSDQIGPLRLFGYTSTRAVAAALTAFVLMMVVMPRLIAWLRLKKFGEQGAKGDGAVVVDRARAAKAGTPTMGGLGLISCLTVAAILWCDPAEPRTWILIAALVLHGGLGYLDDRTKIFKGAKGVPIRVKSAIQIVLAVGLGLWFLSMDQSQAVSALRVDQTATGTPRLEAVLGPVREGLLVLPFMSLDAAIVLPAWLMVMWVLVMCFSCANAVNFTDGMDGLAAGVMLIAALAFMAIAYLSSHGIAAHYLRIAFVPGNTEAAVFCAAVAGACIGFLWYNAPPAQVFMGDTGSQALGGALAMVALCSKQEFLVLLVGFVFFVEALSVFLQVLSFRSTGRRIFLCAPVHHHFQYLGWPETRIVLRFWMVAALMALLALATLKLR